MNKVIIVGGNHHNTLGVIRAFGRCGIKPYVILTTIVSDSFVLKSKYIHKSWIMESKQVVNFLLSNFIFTEKPVLIACHDIISSIFDFNYNVLSKYFYVPGAKEEGRISKFSEKRVMSELAINVGMNVPKYRVLCYDNVTNSLANINDVEYPCITKPIASRDGSKADICICRTEKDLLKFLKEHPGRQFIVQTFVDKEFEFQLIGCSLDDGNNIIIPGVSILIRPSKASNTGFLKYTTLDTSYEDVLQKSKDFIRLTSYNGLFSIEFLRDKTGVDYFMEMNFRNDGNSICVTNSGVNLPMIWYENSIGKVTIDKCVIHEEYVMPEFQELEFWYAGEISLLTMIKDFYKATSYMDYDKNDPLPTNGWKKFFKLFIRNLCVKPIKVLLNK